MDQEIIDILAEERPDLLELFIRSDYLHFGPRFDSDETFYEDITIPDDDGTLYTIKDVNLKGCKDQQTAFLNSKNMGIDIVLAGNGAGKNCLSNYKLTKIVLNEPPPIDLATFVCVSENMELAGKNYVESLRYFLDAQFIEHISFFNAANMYPKSIILKPHKNGKRWRIEFRSYEQGPKSFVGTGATCGYWLDEYFTLPILREIDRGTRRFNPIPGARWITLTPSLGHIECEQIYNDQENHPEFTFYSFNTLKNTVINWNWIKNVPKDQLATRLFGTFTHPEGRIFIEFENRHIIKTPKSYMQGTHFNISIDWGASVEHKTAVLWIASQPDGRHFVYDELLLQQKLIPDIIKQIKAKHPEFVFNRKDHHIWADPAGLQERLELSNAGIPCIIWRKEPVVYAIDSSRVLFAQDKLFIDEKCKNLINEIRMYEWKPNSVKQEPKKINDDLVDALKNFTYSYMGNMTLRLPETKMPERDRFGWRINNEDQDILKRY